MRATVPPRTGCDVGTHGCIDAADRGEAFDDDVPLAAFAVDTTGLDLDSDVAFERRSRLPISPERLTLLHRPDWT
jgi:hypothetical protein